MTFSLDRVVDAALHNVKFYINLSYSDAQHYLDRHALRIRQEQDRRHVAMVNQFRKERAQRYWQENHTRLYHQLRGRRVFAPTNLDLEGN